MSEKVLMKGNEAIGEAALRSGCTHFFGYPITPQTELPAYMSKVMPKMGRTYLQAESEIGAINMVFGAAGAGARVMTSSSSPGISLKQEGISYLAGAELPCVIVNIMRVGPGLGGIQPAQSDYFQATKGGGHGDYRILVYAPSSVQEMVDLTRKAFDKSDEYRFPAMILGDGLLGQMMEPVEFPPSVEIEDIPKRPWATTGTGLMRGKNIISSLHLQAKEFEEMLLERKKKYDYIKENECMYEEVNTSDADIILVAYGITARIATTAMRMARDEGLKVGLIRPITLWPFPYRALERAAKTAKAFLTVEMSMGQMVEDVKLGVLGNAEVYFYGRLGGVVPDQDGILDEIRKIANGGGEEWR